MNLRGRASHSICEVRKITKRMLRKSFLLVALSVFVAAHHETSDTARAIVKMSSPTGQPIYGNVTFTQLTDGPVHLTGTIVGLPPGLYGFHVHEKGDITGGCVSAGSHYNPHHKQHGHPDDENRHVGDLGNLQFDENHVANVDLTDNLLSLVGPNSIVGRTLVLHEKTDDYGKTDHPDSRTTGNAGGRVACGVIGIVVPGTPMNAASSISPALSVILFVIALSLQL